MQNSLQNAHILEEEIKKILQYFAGKEVFEMALRQPQKSWHFTRKLRVENGGRLAGASLVFINAFPVFEFNSPILRTEGGLKALVSR